MDASVTLLDASPLDFSEMDASALQEAQSSTNPAHHPTPFSRLPLYKSKRRREAFAASGPLEPASEVTRANLSTKAKRNHPRGNSDTEKEESGRTEIEESPRMDLGRTPSS